MADLLITKAEQKAIASVERAIKKMPDSISLFSFSGTLVATKKDENGTPCFLDSISSKFIDGGDPDENELRQNVKVEYE